MSSDITPKLSPAELDEAVKLLQGLIRIDTTNPPGNESKCAEHLKAFFESNDIGCEVIGEPGRENVVAKIEGANERPRLLLLSHTDVVPATNVGTWKHPPFSGEIEDNWIYGRGAVDDKFDAAVQAMAFVLTKRRNARLNGTLLYVSVSDEEINGSGADWLTTKVPSKVAAEYVVGEGGGPPFKIGARKAYKISTGEKGCAWLRLTAKGRAGHGSIPTLADNANVKMAKAILNISNLKTKTTIHRDVVAEVRLVTRALFGEKQGSRLIKDYLNPRALDKLLDKISLRDKELAEELRSITRMTISPNVVHGGTETNVIPGTCEGQVDIRLIPSQDRDDAIRTITECVKGLDVDVDAYQYSEVSASPSNTPFYDAIRSTLTEMSSEFVAVPQISAGASDSRFWRQLGSVVYGCVPLSYEAKMSEVSRGVHAANERVDTGSLSLGTRFLCKLIQRALD